MLWESWPSWLGRGLREEGDGAKLGENSLAIVLDFTRVEDSQRLVNGEDQDGNIYN